MPGKILLLIAAPMLAPFSLCTRQTSPNLFRRRRRWTPMPRCSLRLRRWTWTMYQRIRDEGLNHSHVMEFASALMDGIGPRLTGSPNAKKANEWTRDTLTKIGLENAHLEDWGEFGLGWQQLNTWARMVAPDTAVLIVQATPWSPSTPGPVTGEVAFVSIQTEKDLDKYKGKLGGKVVLYGAMRDVPPVDKALFDRYSEKELEDIAAFPVNADGGGMSPAMQARLRTYTGARRG